ncbi:hypothetical protein BD779DRAFT_582746 [Infundibulicybe gibba]|nr:hypothetical protein BD779DRAFT_582746 [Infundibulicybe gibba]
MLARIIRLSFLSFCLLFSIPRVTAQTSWSKNGPTASCLPNTLQWAFNSLNQSPCLVAQFLLNACDTSESLLIPPVQVDNPYEMLSPTPCTCNTVFYSVLSACAVCQNGSFLRWSEYSVNCTSPSFRTLPEGVPDGTRIPHYAFHDVLPTDGFNMTLFQADSGLPDVTSNVSLAQQLASATSTVQSLTSQTQSATKLQTSQTQATGQSGVNPNPALAFRTVDIIGIVIGVLGVLLTTATGLVWWCTRSRSSRRTRTEPDAEASPRVEEDEIKSPQAPRSTMQCLRCLELVLCIPPPRSQTSTQCLLLLPRGE